MKQNNSIAIIVVIMALISFLCLSLSVSYSFIISSVSSTSVQAIATSNLDAQISFTDSSLAAEPMSDEDGLSQSTYGLIDITKENDYSVYYTINIKYDTGSLPTGVTTDNLLPMENLKIALFEVIGGVPSADPLVGPVRIADLPIGKYDVNDNYQTEYFLANGIFDPGQDTATYAVKVWIDEDVSEDYEGYHVYLGANIVQEPLYSKNVYNLQGGINFPEGDGTGAVLEFQNGLYTVTAGENGLYTLENVVSGTYNLEITYNGETYESTVNINYNDDEYLENPSDYGEVGTVGPSNGYSNSYIQKDAYTYYTTPYKIMQYNSINNSNELTGADYTIPSAVIIRGPRAIGPVTVNYVYFYIEDDGSIIANNDR